MHPLSLHFLGWLQMPWRLCRNFFGVKMRYQEDPGTHCISQEQVRANLAKYQNHELVMCPHCAYIGPAGFIGYATAEGFSTGLAVLLLVAGLAAIIFQANGYPMWLFWLVVFPLLAYITVGPSKVYECPCCVAEIKKP